MPMAETKETRDSELFTQYNRKEKTWSSQDRLVFSLKYSQTLKNKLDLSLMKTEMRTRLIPKEHLRQSKFLNRKGRDSVLELWFGGKSFRYLQGPKS